MNFLRRGVLPHSQRGQPPVGWQFAGLDGLATLTSNSPFPFDISKSSNPGWPDIDPEVRNTLALKDLDFQAGPNVLAPAIPAAGDFLAVNLTSDARLVFGYGGDDPATQNRTIEIVDSHIAPTANTRALHVRFAASVTVQSSELTSTLSAIFLEDTVRVVTIRDGSMLSACPNSPVIDGRSAFHPYEECTVSVSDSTVAGNGFLAVSGLRPVVELDNVQCCDCSSNCVLDGCQVIGGGGIYGRGVPGEQADLDEHVPFSVGIEIEAVAVWPLASGLSGHSTRRSQPLHRMNFRITAVAR